ncbi:MAG: hypothetical protein SGJ10_00940 [Bacteroidota bacterium]|nr:hypothetical protein [Bacteroidota bacterium]
MNIKLAISILLAMSLSSCGLIRNTPKNLFNDGYYVQTNDGSKRHVYIEIEDEILRIHQTKKINKLVIVDTNVSIEVYPKELNTVNNKVSVFNKNSFDIDFLTMPLKYRPSQKGVPSQLNTNLNGSVYTGYRTDKYIVSYATNPLNKSDRTINHYGFSFGFFGGLGNTAITPTTTNNHLTTEYDGVIFTKGTAGIIAVNNFTVGIAIGLDNLLDNNNKFWVYQSKPWFGFAFGLNLN